MIMRKYFLMLGRNKATVVYGCLWVWLAPDDLSHHLLWLVHNRALWTWWFKAKHGYYPHSFSGSGVWARLPWSRCSVSHKAEMRALARLCFPSEALTENVDWCLQNLLNPVYSVRTSLLTGRAFQALQTAYILLPALLSMGSLPNSAFKLWREPHSLLYAKPAVWIKNSTGESAIPYPIDISKAGGPPILQGLLHTDVTPGTITYRHSLPALSAEYICHSMPAIILFKFGCVLELKGLVVNEAVFTMWFGKVKFLHYTKWAIRCWFGCFCVSKWWMPSHA